MNSNHLNSKDYCGVKLCVEFEVGCVSWTHASKSELDKGFVYTLQNVNKLLSFKLKVCSENSDFCTCKSPSDSESEQMLPAL